MAVISLASYRSRYNVFNEMRQGFNGHAIDFLGDRDFFWIFQVRQNQENLYDFADFFPETITVSDNVSFLQIDFLARFFEIYYIDNTETLSVDFFNLYDDLKRYGAII